MQNLDFKQNTCYSYVTDSLIYSRLLFQAAGIQIWPSVKELAHNELLIMHYSKHFAVLSFLGMIVFHFL